MDVRSRWLPDLLRAERRRAERKRLREREVKNRIRRMEREQRHDRRIEEDLIFQGPTAILPRMPSYDLWFVSEDMNGIPGYILQYLGAAAKIALPESVIRKVDHKFNQPDWMINKFTSHENDRINYENGPSDSNLLNSRLNWLKELCQDPQPEPFDEATGFWDGILPPGNSANFELVVLIYKLLDDLTLLERFIDPRNHEVSDMPLPDGSNLDNAPLKASWVLHRAWIRALHYRSLHAGEKHYGAYQIQHILKLVWAFNEGEHIHIPHDRLRRPEFGSFYGLVASLGQALIGFTEDLFKETRPMHGTRHYGENATLLYNLHPERFANLWKQNFDPKKLDNRYILWSTLLGHARDFEMRMTFEHVEDVLIDKRVVVQDEPYELDEIIDCRSRPVELGLMSVPQYSMDVFLSEISRVNRHRRNYLLLRDWSKRRPWKQLYHVFDTQDREQDHLRQLIPEFYSEIAGLAALDPPPGPNGPSPSRLSNIWSSLFTFHPVASHDPTPIADFGFDGGCTICQEDFADDQTIVLLHCNHLFHYICIRNYWDMEGQHTFRCVNCRQVKWALHEVVGITPEVIDVWDNINIATDDDPIPDPDFTLENSLYWDNENSLLDSILNWDTDNAHPHEHGPRDVTVEMAAVRQVRRERNKRRRALYRSIGIPALDGPPSPDP